MTKEEIAKRLDVSIEFLNAVIKSCNYTEVKNFSSVHESVMRSYIKKSSSCVIESKEDKKPTNELAVCHKIENVEVVTVKRKELIELISRAYHKGLEDGKHSFLIADSQRLNEIFEEAING